MDVVAPPTSTSASETPALPDNPDQKLGLVPSHGIFIDEKPASSNERPPLVSHVSAPAYNSPLRHHHRHASSARQVKESLNAHSEYITSQDDGVAEHRINQYIIKQEIGRGSFGAVHLAVDQYGEEFAVKEFSKARLRKRAQSHILRKPWSQRRAGALAARQGFNSPLHRNPGGSAQNGQQAPSSIELIKEEIAIMKKLNHQNLVSLLEVLDDPSEDSLYMVMEMCKKGVVMKVGLEEQADPYPDETCRCWFRDLILGMEYLHAQGVVHRDIKPDNCLITQDDVLKIVDFGVSEMFEKDTEMVTAKSAGSPAFLPPELCVAKHGDVSGKAADIWSMGATLYCLKYGRIPFEKASIFELYDAIKEEPVNLDGESDVDFLDLMVRILEKDPARRIKMRELREHPWVTKRGKDPLLPEEENTSNLVEPPTEAEMNAAITGNMRNLMTVVKAVNKFKALTASKRPTVMNSILGEHDAARFSQPPTAIQKDKVPLPHLEHKSNSVDTFDRGHMEGALVADGVHREMDISNLAGADDTPSAPFNEAHDPSRRSKATALPPALPDEASTDSSMTGFGTPSALPDKFPPFRGNRPYAQTADDVGQRGQAHDPLDDHLYLFIGPSTFAAPSVNPDRRPSFVPDDDDIAFVSESPGAADVDIYETAYRDEIERIKARAKAQEKEEPAVYLTRRVDAKLLALSGKAGRLAAVGEEGLNQFRDFAQFRERKAKVTEVSRALREAAKEEYLRRKQEKKEALETAKLERTQTKEAEASKTDEGPQSPGSEVRPPLSPASPDLEPLQKSSSRSTEWKGKAVDRGRRAKTSLMGMVDMMKSKGRGDKGGSGSA